MLMIICIAANRAQRRVFTYAIFMLEAALSDKVAGVLWGGLSLLRTLIGCYAKELSPLEVRPPPLRRASTPYRRIPGALFEQSNHAYCALALTPSYSPGHMNDAYAVTRLLCRCITGSRSFCRR